MEPPFTYVGRVGSAFLTFWIILTSVGDVYAYEINLYEQVW